MQNTFDPLAATTLPQLLRATAAAYGDETAIRLTGETIPSESATFEELDRKSAAIAGHACLAVALAWLSCAAPAIVALLPAGTRADAVLVVPDGTLVENRP